MAVTWQLSGSPGATDYPFFNYGVTDIPASVAVGIDATNLLGTGTNDGIGIIVPAADGDPTVGVTMETIKASGSGRVRCLGPIAQMTANGTVVAGTYAQASGTTSKKGWAMTAGTAKGSLGIFLTGAADGESVLVLLGGAKNA